MRIFDVVKPRSGKTDAQKRAKDVQRLMEKLMESEDIETFRAGLKDDLGITEDHPNYETMLSIWNNAE